MEAKQPLTAADIDQEYRQVCAEIGQLYLKREDLASQLKSADVDLARLKDALLQIVSRHRAVAHNESLNVVEGRFGK